MGGSILVVDDDVAFREWLGEVLNDAGYRVVGVGDGDAALAHLASGARPDVILFDLMMPNLNGWDFRVAQLASPALADIPAIAISASDCRASPLWDTLGVTVRLKKRVPLQPLLEALVPSIEMMVATAGRRSPPNDAA